MTRNTCIHISLGGPAQDRAGRRAESGERNAKKERARGQAVNTWPTLIRSACLVQPCNRNRNPSKSISNYPTLPHHPSSNLKPSVLHTMAEAVPTEAAPTEPQARHVVYCGVCSLPPEYCEFGGTAKKCKEWLEQSHPDMHEKLYSEEAITASLSTLSVDAQKRAEKDSKKKEAKAAAAEAREAEAKKEAMVYIKRVERNKRKYVTAVSGLEAHGMDLKKVAKEFGKKFATGSSVTKTASGGEEIVVQGDNSDDIFDWVVDVGGVPDENVECIEDKKKKSAG